MKRWPALLAAACIAVGAGAGSLAARESLGVFGGWGAFSDPAAGRCYAIAQAEPDARVRERQPYMTVGTWPRTGIRGELYWQLSRHPKATAPATAQVGGRSFALQVAGAGAWARDVGMEAAIRSAMRSSQTLTVFYRDSKGRRFFDRYRLAGAATALDAATLACARRN